jgi:hypothetical protein
MVTTKEITGRYLQEGQLGKLRQVGKDKYHPKGHSFIISMSYSYARIFKLRKGQFFIWYIISEGGPTFMPQTNRDI